MAASAEIFSAPSWTQRRFGLSPCKPIKQISCRRQRETQNRTPEIQVMTHATLETPVHTWKPVKRFANMTKADNYQTSRADQLEKQPDRLSSTKQDNGAGKQQRCERRHD